MKTEGKLRQMTALYLLKGDRMLLLYRIGSRVVEPCWCGIGGHLEPEEIGGILAQCRPEDGDTLRMACEELVEKANERGGSDNITAVIASV